MGMGKWAAVVVAMATAGCASASGGGPVTRTAPVPAPIPTRPVAFGDPCAAISAAQVGAILGTPVAAAERDGATCNFSTVSTSAVGNHDPAETPAPNVALHGAAITVARGTADALSGGRAHFMVKPQPLSIPGADLAFLVGGPHVAVVFAQRGHAALEVVVFRGWTDDAYLAGQLAGAILPSLPAA